MNPLDRQLFFSGFREQLAASMPYEKAEKIWSEAGEEYARILSADPSCATKKDIARKNPETSTVSGFFTSIFQVVCFPSAESAPSGTVPLEQSSTSGCCTGGCYARTVPRVISYTAVPSW